MRPSRAAELIADVALRGSQGRDHRVRWTRSAGVLLPWHDPRGMIVEVAAPSRRRDGSYRLENTFRYPIAGARPGFRAARHAPTPGRQRAI